ncbi:U-box domain-containing protein 11-like [Macadamia integrifolia]|uniref:U-box domain-containing protein 11-like n=1 Tax=Macadamia integrifolia TaxID=60698 RepID=UPI001C530FDD|nr:U-box domain-containing protein 11-like [Macadamia integrifolia]XP_042519600.1 U-box domain-containing protein 11-like [Macadamia integrifolia]
MDVQEKTARSLVKSLSSVSEQSRIEALCELRLMSKYDPESRSFIADAGAVPHLIETLYSSSPLAQENAVATILNISIANREFLMMTPDLLDALSHLLRHPSATPISVQTASATLYSLLIDEDNRPIIGSKLDIVESLINITRDTASPMRSIKEALKALFAISLYPLNRSAMVELGVVAALFSFIVKDGQVGLVEDATAVIAQVAGCCESGDAFRKVSGLTVLVDLIDPSTRSSVRARENAVSALLNLVQCGGEKSVLEVKEMCLGVLDGIRDVAESGSAKGKSKGTALLKVLGGGDLDKALKDPRFDYNLDHEP